MSETPSGRVAASRLVPAAVGLGVLAVAQPLLDLLGRQPQFLVAHDLSPTEVTILAVMVVVMPAALFGLSAMLASGRWMAGLLVAIPVFLIFAHAGSRMEVDGPLMLILAAGLTTLTVATYFRYPPVQEVARYLVAVPAAVLVYFFVVLPAPVLAGDTPTGGGEVAREPVPVVVIVLDEFPLASLIDGEGRLLKEQYPSFGRLAEDGVWYRNAITVETRTTESIPAILSGLEVGDGLVPTASQHPRTLFTLLAGSHDVGGMEPVTSLCPDQLCGDGADGRWIGTWARVASDVAVVYGHLVVPSPWVDRLPPIDQNWTGFGTSAEADADARSEWDLEEAVGGAVGAGRRAAVGRFLDDLSVDSDRPPLRVVHLVLPHRPWEYLPDGTRHGQQGVEGYGGRGWGSDPYFVAEGWKRHLLQVGYTDTVVGSVISRLEEEGIYRSSLIVVVADHGVRFDTDVQDMRVTNRDSIGSILPVPFFVKYPADLPGAPSPGTIDDRRVETIDGAPTVYDVVDLDPGDDLDGRSLLADWSRERSVLELRGEPFPVDAGGEEKLEVAGEKEKWFPGGDPWSLVPTPDVRTLLGEKLPIFDDPDVEVALDGDPSSAPLIEGTVRAEDVSVAGEGLVGLTADGTLVSVGKLFEGDEGLMRFSFLIDPEAGYRPPYRAWLLSGGRLTG